MKQVGATDVAKFKKVVFQFNYSLRNEEVSTASVKGDFVIDRAGLIYQNGNPSSSATVTIIGGEGKFVHQLGTRPTGTYMSVPQRRTLNFILQQIAARHFDADVSSPDYDLNNFVMTTHFNHQG